MSSSNSRNIKQAKTFSKHVLLIRTMSVIKGPGQSDTEHRQEHVIDQSLVGTVGSESSPLKKVGVLKRTVVEVRVYLELVYLVTALVPSDTACLASSPGSSRRTAVWISREVMVDLLL